MFKTIDNWTIVINNNNNELEELHNIWHECYQLYMREYSAPFVSLKYAIHVLEEQLHTHDQTKNGDLITTERNSIDDSFSEARKWSNDDLKLKNWLIKHIYILHRAIDETADIIPVMIQYYNELKNGEFERKESQCDTSEQWISTLYGEDDVLRYIPNIHLYNCCKNIPADIKYDKYDPDNYYDMGYFV